VAQQHRLGGVVWTESTRRWIGSGGVGGRRFGKIDPENSCKVGRWIDFDDPADETASLGQLLPHLLVQGCGNVPDVIAAPLDADGIRIRWMGRFRYQVEFQPEPEDWHQDRPIVKGECPYEEAVRRGVRRTRRLRWRYRFRAGSRDPGEEGPARKTGIGRRIGLTFEPVEDAHQRSSTRLQGSVVNGCDTPVQYSGRVAALQPAILFFRSDG
jgi:hypothetical protein